MSVVSWRSKIENQRSKIIKQFKFVWKSQKHVNKTKNRAKSFSNTEYNPKVQVTLHITFQSRAIHHRLQSHNIKIPPFHPPFPPFWNSNPDFKGNNSDPCIDSVTIILRYPTQTVSLRSPMTHSKALLTWHALLLQNSHCNGIDCAIQRTVLGIWYHWDRRASRSRDSWSIGVILQGLGEADFGDRQT